MKYRDKLTLSMAGRNSQEDVDTSARRITKIGSTQILSFGVSSHPLVWPLYKADNLLIVGFDFYHIFIKLAIKF